MPIVLDDDRREALITGIRGFWLEQFDEDLSAFRAEQILDYFLEAAGPQVYDQAVQDARAYMQLRLDDLDGDVYVPEGTP